MEVLLGIDVGNTNIKCIAIEPSGNCIKLIINPVEKTDTIYKVDVLFNTVCNALREITAALSAQTHILGIAVSSVGCSAIYLDQDEKQFLIEKPVKTTLPDDISAVTGYPASYRNAGVELLSCADDLSLISKVLSISDYIVYKLSGKFGRDISTCGSMSMYDRYNNKWWGTFKTLTGLGDVKLGSIYHSGTMIGEITKEIAEKTGIPEGIPVCFGGHDYLCAAFALGCVDERSILNVLGTYEMVTTFCKDIPHVNNELRIFSDHHCYPGRYSRTCETLAGSQLEWMRKNICGDDSLDFWDIVYKKIDLLPPSFLCEENELFIPRIFGEFFPVRDTTLYGGFFGLTSKSDIFRMIRAVIEGLCMYSKQMIKSISTDDAAKIIIAGGGSRSRLWMQTKADVLGTSIIVPHVPEASATGAALLAGVGIGVYSGHEEASKVYSNAPVNEYTPNIERVWLFEHVYSELFLPALKIATVLNKNIC